MNVDYARYETLNIARRGPDGTVLDVQMKAANGKLPTAGHAGHRELAEIWRDVGADDNVRCAVLRGEGMGFSGGGDLALVQDMANDFETRTRVWKEARDLVYNVINCDKPIVSALHGPAVGAGLVAGLLADISIAARDAKIVVRAQQLAAPGRPGVRHLACAGVHGLRRARRAGRHCLVAGTARAQVLSAAVAG